MQDKNINLKTPKTEPKYIPNKYPIYVISKGRADSRLTVKSLEAMNQPYQVVIEPQDYKDYAAVIDPKKILVLPFSNLGQGSIPARNWVWEHSIEAGAKAHWIMDDNIRWFYRFNRNKKVRVDTNVTIRCCEDFTDRYDNVKMSGMNYFFFAPSNVKMPPYYLNTRIYSCILLSNDIEHRWRGRYNEDTDLSLRILKDGWCTILYNAFLCGKQTTMSMKGGNTEEVYAKEQSNFDNRKEFAESLVKQHPDVVKMITRWGRNHHLCDYSKFNQKLIMKPGLEISKGVDNYGMKFIKYDENPDK
jgi:hypothetical protein